MKQNNINKSLKPSRQHIVLSCSYNTIIKKQPTEHILMNSRKIKLALTVGLINKETGNALQILRDMMQAFGDEVGAFLGLKETGTLNLSASHIQHSYAMTFERCTLNVDLVSNAKAQTQVVRQFNLC